MAIYLKKNLDTGKLFSEALAEALAEGYTVEVNSMPMSQTFGSCSGLFMWKEGKRYLLAWLTTYETDFEHGRSMSKEVLLLIHDGARGINEAIKTYRTLYTLAYGVYTDDLAEREEAAKKRKARRQAQRLDRMGTRIDLDCIQSRYIALAYLHRQRGYMRCKLDAVAHVYKWIDADRGRGHFCISTIKGDIFDLR